MQSLSWWELSSQADINADTLSKFWIIPHSSEQEVRSVLQQNIFLSHLHD